MADGTKAGVRNGATGTAGYEYLGSLVYKRTGASSFALESTGFGGGRIAVATSGSTKTYTPNYHITDHLGSVRVVFKDKSNVLARNDFYAFGKRHVNSSLTAGADDLNRFLYNGKEKLITGNVNFLDYGARPYDPEIARWFNPDLLAEKYYAWSPYNYVLNNPIRFIDTDGRKVSIANLSATHQRSLGIYMRSQTGMAFLSRYMSKGETLSAGGQSFTATVTGDRAKDLLLFGLTNISAEGRNTTFIKGAFRPINALAESDIRKIVEYGVKQQIEIGKDVGEKEAVAVLGHETFVHADKDTDALTEIDNIRQNRQLLILVILLLEQ